MLTFLGNIIAYSQVFLDKFFYSKIYEDIIKLFSRSENALSVLRLIIWVAAQSMKFIKTVPPKEKIVELITIFANYLYTTDSEVIFHCIWGLNYASKYDDEFLDICKLILNSGAVVKIMKLNFIKNNLILIPTVRLLGNLSSGPYSIVDVIIFFLIILFRNCWNLNFSTSWT